MWGAWRTLGPWKDAGCWLSMNAWRLPLPLGGITGGNAGLSPRIGTTLTGNQYLMSQTNNFQHKYSSTLQLLGLSHHPAFTHSKLLGRCYDNVHHQGRLIQHCLTVAQILTSFIEPRHSFAPKEVPGNLEPAPYPPWETASALGLPREMPAETDAHQPVTLFMNRCWQEHPIVSIQTLTPLRSLICSGFNSSRPEARSTVPRGVATAAALVDPVAVFSRTMMEVATALLARFAIPV